MTFWQKNIFEFVTCVSALVPATLRYFDFKNIGQFATLKKIMYKNLRSAKNRVRIFFRYSKREETAWPLLEVFALTSDSLSTI